jgi:hypothetical protein
MKTTTKYLRVITLTLTCVGFFPKAQAINPPPDGGYPGGNTAEGQSALLSLTSGTYNTAVGFFSLISNLEVTSIQRLVPGRFWPIPLMKTRLPALERF